MARIGIVGTGYVGVCTGVVFAELGHDVTFVDVDPAKLAAVAAGRAPFYEPGVDEALTAARARISTSGDAAATAATHDFLFICVGTPGRPDGSMDPKYLISAAQSIGQGLARRSKRDAVVVTKSTVLPGTARGVVGPALDEAAGFAVPLVSNPEFLKEGSALADARRPDRIVAGASDIAAAERVLALYADLPGERLIVSNDTAEFIKYAANAFLATKIAFANEMANVAERIGVDWLDVVRGIGPDPRIGPLFLRAGIGFGGSCFPKDVAAIATLAGERGAPSGLLTAVAANNEAQYQVAVDMLRAEIGDLQGKRIALLGLAFKPDTDDIRETRALPLWHALTAAGADVVCHDPRAVQAFVRAEPRARAVEKLDEALRGADAAVIATEWPDYAAVPAAEWPPVVVDGRRALDGPALRAAGSRYRAVGAGDPAR